MSENGRQGKGRATWWLLMGATAGAVAVGYAATRIGAVMEWLTEGPAPVVPATDYSDRKADGASDFPSTDRNRDS